jgi:adenosylcobinamide kinase/adenosylcobinamide-phosphate guanylyltransferase
MDVELGGTAGPGGWPRPGCRCACCGRALAAGRARRPALATVDGVLAIGPGGPAPGGAPDGYQVTALPGGWEVTAPDGGRLLAAAGPGAVPVPPDGAAPYGVLLLDLAGQPFQLGELARRGLIAAGAQAAAWFMDDRVSSEAELARRCALWGATAPADGDRLAAAVPGPVLVPAPAPRPARTLVLGGARSGKSAEAELRLAAEPSVTYLASGPVPDPEADPDWARRVAAHRARRPAHWITAETGDAARTLRRKEDQAILWDGAGSWLTAVLDRSGCWDQPAPRPGWERRVAAEVDDLVCAWRQAPGRVVAVSDEAGSGVIPATAAGRLFRDQLGLLNQRLAAESEEAVLVVAGRVAVLPG